MICGYCGTELPATALFCGECGRSLAAPARRTAPVAVAAQPVFAAPVSDTSILDFSELSEIDGATVVTRSKKSAERVEPVEAPAPERVEPDGTPEPEPAPDPTPAPVEIHDPPQPAPRDPWLPPSRLLRPVDATVEQDLEQTRIVSNTLTGPRFVLQFSTGESVTIFGNGLVGRNPTAEPSEYFDHLVTIVDPGKSVSKTHLEFGQAAGMFWVSDRFSGNGTVIREPDAAPRRGEPGKRYRIARGTRVTMGEQFFVVS